MKNWAKYYLLAGATLIFAGAAGIYNYQRIAEKQLANEKSSSSEEKFAHLAELMSRGGTRDADAKQNRSGRKDLNDDWKNFALKDVDIKNKTPEEAAKEIVAAYRREAKAKNLPVNDFEITFSRKSDSEKISLNFKNTTVAAAMIVLGARAGKSVEMGNGQLNFSDPRTQYALPTSGLANSGSVAIPVGLAERVDDVFGPETSVEEALGLTNAEDGAALANAEDTTPGSLDVPSDRQADVADAIDALMNPTGTRTLYSSVFRVPPGETGPSVGDIPVAQFQQEFQQLSLQKGTEWAMLTPLDVSRPEYASANTNLPGTSFTSDGFYKTQRGYTEQSLRAQVQPDGLGNQVNISADENGQSLGGNSAFFLANDNMQVTEIASQDGFRRYRVIRVASGQP